MASIKAGSIRKGMYIEFKDRPVLVTKADFYSPGKGSAFMRLKLFDVQSGSTQEFTYKSNESAEQLDVESKQMNYLYEDGVSAVFMDPRSYEQIEVPIELVVDVLDLFIADLQVYVLIYAEEPLGVRLPPKVTMTVVDAPDAVAGNTATSARKEVLMETGLKVMAPLFVKTGEKLIIDTETKSYVSRG